MEEQSAASLITGSNETQCEYVRKCNLQSGISCGTDQRFDCLKYIQFRLQEEEQMKYEDLSTCFRFRFQFNLQVLFRPMPSTKFSFLYSFYPVTIWT